MFSLKFIHAKEIYEVNFEIDSYKENYVTPLIALTRLWSSAVFLLHSIIFAQEPKIMTILFHVDKLSE